MVEVVYCPRPHLFIVYPVCVVIGLIKRRLRHLDNARSDCGCVEGLSVKATLQAAHSAPSTRPLSS